MDFPAFLDSSIDDQGASVIEATPEPATQLREDRPLRAPRLLPQPSRIDGIAIPRDPDFTGESAGLTKAPFGPARGDGGALRCKGEFHRKPFES